MSEGTVEDEQLVLFESHDGVAVITLEDPLFPRRLFAIELPPHLLFVRGDQVGSLTFLVKEQSHLFENQIAPLTELIRMDLMLRSQLRKRLLFFKKFKDEFRFEGCRIVLFHGGSDPP